MIIAALMVFGVLFAAWLLAPTREAGPALATEPELTVEPLPHAA